LTQVTEYFVPFRLIAFFVDVASFEVSLEPVQFRRQLEPLFVGKVASAHLPLIHELRTRGIIKPPELKPRYLESAEARQKIERLRGGMKLLELLQL
jgi:hypothetical protein